MRIAILASAIILAVSPAAFAAESGSSNLPGTNAQGRDNSNMPSDRSAAPTKSGSSAAAGNGASTGTSGMDTTPNTPSQSETSSQKMNPGSTPSGTSQ